MRCFCTGGAQGAQQAEAAVRGPGSLRKCQADDDGAQRTLVLMVLSALLTAAALLARYDSNDETFSRLYGGCMVVLKVYRTVASTGKLPAPVPTLGLTLTTKLFLTAFTATAGTGDTAIKC